MSPQRPGGELAARPLDFFWICDRSGSMSTEGKIQSLNAAIHESLPHMREVAAQNPFARIRIRSLAFSHGAAWHPMAGPVPIEEFRWTDLEADPMAGGAATADVVFLVDTSGSMSDEIEAVKSSCVDFADRIAAEGACVRLGLVGFDIGGHRGNAAGYTVHALSRYTIGIWPLTDPRRFKSNIGALSLGLFGGGGCYLANADTVDIFPHVVQVFDGPAEHKRILVVVSDEIGGNEGLDEIVDRLERDRITTHVLGVALARGAHEEIARRTGGKFWSIEEVHGIHSFAGILDDVASTIAQEIKRELAGGAVSLGTDMGAALRLAATELRVPPMPVRALPPVLSLVSDGQPTDDFEPALAELLGLPWGKKAVRIAIGIGRDADLGVLERFIANPEIKPLHALNSEELTRYIRWASTAVVAAASAPPSQSRGGGGAGNVPIPSPPAVSGEAGDVW
jgi:uncharacterized protein YegL